MGKCPADVISFHGTELRCFIPLKTSMKTTGLRTEFLFAFSKVTRIQADSHYRQPTSNDTLLALAILVLALT